MHNWISAESNHQNAASQLVRGIGGLFGAVVASRSSMGGSRETELGDKVSLTCTGLHPKELGRLPSQHR